MKWLSLKLLAAVLLLTLIGGSYAAADAVVRSFNGKGSIKSGQVVALVSTDKSTVELAPADDPTRIYGVVVDQSSPPVTASQPGQTVFVATSGFYPVLVSTENGSIAAGDYLSMSSTPGTAAKIKGSQTFVLGRSTQNFDGKTGSLGSGQNGSLVGKISVQIAPGKNPALRESTAVPAPLRKLAESIAGKPLSASRIYSALIIFIVTAIIAFGLLWVGISSGMIAIGRNPLSKHSVMQSLAQVIIASAVVFVGGLFGIYLFLRI